MLKIANGPELWAEWRRRSGRAGSALAAVLTWACVAEACGAHDYAAPTREELDASVAAIGAFDASEAGAADGAAAAPPGCDLSGIWIARLNTESRAFTLPQYANTWYYYELAQYGSELVVTRHFDCGIEVRGTVKVSLSRETASGLRAHNLQTGRRGLVTREDDGTCALEMERFWSVRSLSEAAYVPAQRSSELPLASIQASLPLPAASMPGSVEDWDGDGIPGVRWIVSGIVAGSRHSVQRDWNRFYTAPGYTIAASSEFREELVLRAEFENEEVVFASDPGLSQISQASLTAEHTLTLRHLGRTPTDERALSILRDDPHETCLLVQSALPSVAGLR